MISDNLGLDELQSQARAATLGNPVQQEKAPSAAVAVWRDRKRVFVAWSRLDCLDVYNRAAVLLGLRLEEMIGERRRIHILGKYAALYVSLKLFRSLTYNHISEIINFPCPSTVRYQWLQLPNRIVFDDFFRAFVVRLYLACVKYETPVRGGQAFELLTAVYRRDGFLLSPEDLILANSRPNSPK